MSGSLCSPDEILAEEHQGDRRLPRFPQQLRVLVYGASLCWEIMRYALCERLIALVEPVGVLAEGHSVKPL